MKPYILLDMSIKIIHRLIFILSFIAFSFIMNNNITAQTKVVKRSALKSNDYGVNYFLPKSVIHIEANVTRVETKAGPYYKYAEKYLGLNNVVTENSSYYELDEVTAYSKGIPDKENSYVVELKSGTTAPFVYLTESGLICAINAEYEPEESEKRKDSSNSPSSLGTTPESLFTEEYLQAGSTAKMAEVAAKQIYKIRESRMDILTGDAENAPKDGDAMKLVLSQLESQEKALVELFAGTVSKSSQTFSFEVEPVESMDKEIIFRFSKYLGVVGVDDLSGVPVYVNLKKIDNSLETVPQKKASKGVYYNVPGQGAVEIFYGVNKMWSGTLDLSQFGIVQILANPIFEDKKAPVKVYFYPETGGIKRIIQ